MVLACQSSSAPAGLGPKENDTAITWIRFSADGSGNAGSGLAHRALGRAGLQVLQVVGRGRVDPAGDRAARELHPGPPPTRVDLVVVLRDE